MVEQSSTSEEITKKSASNLALAFVVLSPEKRKAMTTLYAFCREVDDVADDEVQPLDWKRSELNRWRTDLDRVYDSNQTPQIPTNVELKETLKSFKLPKQYFLDLLDGVETDLDQNRFQTLEELELYCYRVASAVGLLSIEIFGYNSSKIPDYAVALGKALQLTNILRDPKVDAQRGYIYIPLELLERFQVREEEILNSQYSARYKDLGGFLSERAKEFYRQAANFLPQEERGSMIAAELMGAVYWRLLMKLDRVEYNVFSVDLVRIGKPVKLALILKTWLKTVLGIHSKNYGTR